MTYQRATGANYRSYRTRRRKLDERDSTYALFGKVAGKAAKQDSSPCSLLICKSGRTAFRSIVPSGIFSASRLYHRSQRGSNNLGWAKTVHHDQREQESAHWTSAQVSISGFEIFTWSYYGSKSSIREWGEDRHGEKTEQWLTLQEASITIFRNAQENRLPLSRQLAGIFEESLDTH